MRIGDEMGRKPRLVPVPPRLMFRTLTALKKHSLASGLFSDLVVDSGGFRAATQWRAATDLEQGLSLTAQWYRRLAGAA